MHEYIQYKLHNGVFIVGIFIAATPNVYADCISDQTQCNIQCLSNYRDTACVSRCFSQAQNCIASQQTNNQSNRVEPTATNDLASPTYEQPSYEQPSYKHSSKNENRHESEYVSGLSSSCVRELWDSRFYNWLSFQNNCGQRIYLTFIDSRNQGSGSMHLASSASDNTGRSQAEITKMGSYSLFVCPEGYSPVDSITKQVVSRVNQSFICKHQ